MFYCLVFLAGLGLGTFYGGYIAGKNQGKIARRAALMAIAEATEESIPASIREKALDKLRSSPDDRFIPAGTPSKNV